MKIATAAYPLSFFATWQDYEDKITHWVEQAVAEGAVLLVFPEYGAMELASLAGEAAAGDVIGSVTAVADHLAKAARLHRQLAMAHGVHILMASGPARTDPARLDPAQAAGAMVNRAYLLAPSGAVTFQDKQIMTRFERDDWNIAGGEGLRVFETALGRIGVLICYDSEFPLLGRALAEAGVEILLVPSCTEALEGYWRVRIGAMARALESQCVAVMASIVGVEPRLFAVEENCGAGGIFGPPDRGFPPTGVLAEGALNQPGWTYAEVDLEQVRTVRADGHVLNRSHWPEQVARLAVENVEMRASAPST